MKDWIKCPSLIWSNTSCAMCGHSARLCDCVCVWEGDSGSGSGREIKTLLTIPVTGSERLASSLHRRLPYLLSRFHLKLPAKKKQHVFLANRNATPEFFSRTKKQGEVQYHASVLNVTVPLVIGRAARPPVGQKRRRKREKKKSLNASLSTLTFSASHSQPLDLFSLRHESHT